VCRAAACARTPAGGPQTWRGVRGLGLGDGRLLLYGKGAANGTKAAHNRHSNREDNVGVSPAGEQGGRPVRERGAASGRGGRQVGARRAPSWHRCCAKLALRPPPGGRGLEGQCSMRGAARRRRCGLDWRRRGGPLRREVSPRGAGPGGPAPRPAGRWVRTGGISRGGNGQSWPNTVKGGQTRGPRAGRGRLGEPPGPVCGRVWVRRGSGGALGPATGEGRRERARRRVRGL
jgi:hypothetical protein